MFNLDIATDLAKRTVKAHREKAYADLHLIMDEIISSPRPVEVLSQVLPRTIGSSIKALFLSNLTKLAELSLNDYKELYGLLSGQEMAIYDLTYFLTSIGGFHGAHLREFYLECPPRQWNGQTFIRSEGSDWVEMPVAEGEERLFRMYAQEYGVTEDEIRAFRKHLRSLV